MAQAALEAMFRSYAAEHPGDPARALEELPSKDASRLIAGLSPRTTGPVQERVRPDAAAAILGALGPDPTKDLLALMEARHAAAILYHLEDVAREATYIAMDAQRWARHRGVPPCTPEALLRHVERVWCQNSNDGHAARS